MEQQFQSKLKKKLERDGWWVIKLIKCSEAGMPDLMCIKDGVVKFIECKSNKGKLSELQKYKISKLINNKIGVTVEYEQNSN